MKRFWAHVKKHPTINNEIPKNLVVEYDLNNQPILSTTNLEKAEVFLRNFLLVFYH